MLFWHEIRHHLFSKKIICMEYNSEKQSEQFFWTVTEICVIHFYKWLIGKKKRGLWNAHVRTHTHPPTHPLNHCTLWQHWNKPCCYGQPMFILRTLDKKEHRWDKHFLQTWTTLLWYTAPWYAFLTIPVSVLRTEQKNVWGSFNQLFGSSDITLWLFCQILSLLSDRSLFCHLL